MNKKEVENLVSTLNEELMKFLDEHPYGVPSYSHDFRTRMRNIVVKCCSDLIIIDE